MNKKSQTSSKAKAGAATKRKASAGKSATTAKDLFSNQDSDAPDLNTSAGYPVHPNRIWPD